MNSGSPPSLVAPPRSAAAIAAALRERLQARGFDDPADLMAEALVRIAARYGEILGGCFDAAPDLHLADFADLVALPRRPATAARGYVSVKAAGGTGARLPMYSRVAAPAGVPVVFETLAQLDVVPAEATRAVFADAGHWQLTDVDAVVTGSGAPPMPAPAVRALHIGQRAAFGLAGLREIRVAITVEPGAMAASFDWVAGELPLVVVADGTGGLARSGEVVLAAPPAWPETVVDGTKSRWLTLRLRVPVPDHYRPPRITAIGIVASADVGPAAVAAAASDGVPLDVSKDVFPFGERPRFGAVFQLLHPAFAEPAARIELAVVLTNPADAAASPIPVVMRDGLPDVAWEIATTRGFVAVAVDDGTQALTEDGIVRFSVPVDVAAVTVAGATGTWLRARLAGGHYGTVASGPRAPAIKSLSVRSTIVRGPLETELLMAQGALANVRGDPRLASPVDLFPPPEGDGAALYIGLDAVGGGNVFDALGAGSVLSWHVRPHPAAPPLTLGEPVTGASPPRWQVRGSAGWRDVAVRDGSAGLTRSGIVELTLPEPPAPWPGTRLGAHRAWLRLAWPADTVPLLPDALTLNSVAVRQSEQLRGEVVGSSNGRGDQRFHALRTPIVGDVAVEVREDGDDWQRWTRVDRLDGAAAGARVFTVEPTTGELRFGDGRTGRIPPAGASNIRLAHYATGGGVRGNAPAGAIVQLRSAVPAVAAVINLEPATGGLDAEDAAATRRGASAWLRHRDRAIGTDDYADLALRASPDVARAHCVGGRDLAGDTPAAPRAGMVSTIVVPRGTEPQPQPGLDLLATVKAYLDARRPAAGQLVVVGPTYTPVGVRLRLAVGAGWSPDGVAAVCRARIAAFLHPLDGGPAGRGWGFGERPHHSDFYALLDGVDGVERVDRLVLAVEPPPGRPILVAAGAIEVDTGGAPW